MRQFSTRGYVAFYGAALLALAMLSASCAPFTYNRYQTAHTLGAGKMKLTVAANTGADQASQIAPEMIDEMEKKLDVWALDHPDYAYMVEKINHAEFWDEFEYTGFDGSYPDGELVFAAGVTDRVDVELRVSGTLYTRLNTKIMLTKLGRNGALAISPGVGWRWIKEQEYMLGYHMCTDSFQGNGYTAELPLILGWEFSHVSPYVAPLYAFHFMQIDYTRDANVVPTFKATITEQIYAHQAGLAVGAQIKLGDILLTPEAVALYHFHEDVDMFAVYPGLAVGVGW